MLSGRKGNFTIIGLLIAVAVIVVAAVFLFKGGLMTTANKDTKLLDKSSQKQTVVGQSLDTAKAAECRSNLKQIRTAIEMEKTTSGTVPKSLQDLKMGVSSDFFQCPVSGKAYEYNPSTGEVRCPTHPTH